MINKFMIISKKKIFLIILSSLIFLIFNNFFYNFYFILKSDYQKRMTYHYGYCNDSGYGFIKDIYDKYKIDKNIRIVNYLENPNSEWFFYNPNKDFIKNKLIILNLKNYEKIENNILQIKNQNLEKYKYKIIENHKNCYFLENIND